MWYLLWSRRLSTGSVPACFKKAVVKPLIKKPYLDAQILSKYCSVSNLSKILEKAVKAQSDLMDKYQSSYRVSHITETALNSVLNNIKTIVNSADIAILDLHLSEVFDTTDNARLLYHLENDWLEQHCPGMVFIEPDRQDTLSSDKQDHVEQRKSHMCCPSCHYIGCNDLF